MATSKGSPAETEDFFTLVGNVFKMINASWEALVLNLSTFIMLALVPAILSIIAIPFVFWPLLSGSHASMFISTLVIIVLVLIAFIFLPAITITQIESVKGNKIDFNKVFERSKPLVLPYLAIGILTVLAVVVGLVLLIIPGLLAAFFLSMSTYILVDKKLGVFESMQASFELVKNNWEWVVALFIVNFAVSLVTYIPFIGWMVGLVLSVMYFCLPALVYVKISKK